jgi:hypothetical protein
VTLKWTIPEIRADAAALSTTAEPGHIQVDLDNRVIFLRNDAGAWEAVAQPAGTATPPVAASETQAGVSEHATAAEMTAGAVDRVPTAERVKNYVTGLTASTTQAGISEYATTAETETGTDTARTVTPEGAASTFYKRSELVKSTNALDGAAGLSSYPTGFSLMEVTSAGAGWPTAHTYMVQTVKTSGSVGTQKATKLAGDFDERYERQASSSSAWHPWERMVDATYLSSQFTALGVLGRVTKRATADEAKTSDTTLGNHADLTFAIGSNEIWMFEFVIFLTGASGADAKMAVNCSTADEIYYGMYGHGLAVSAFPASVQQTEAVAQASGTVVSTGTITNGASDMLMVFIKGLVDNGASAGNVNFRWAQNTSLGTATTIRKHSHLTASRIA